MASELPRPQVETFRSLVVGRPDRIDQAEPYHLVALDGSAEQTLPPIRARCRTTR